MNPEAMEPFGVALLSYLGGDSHAELIIRRDDGKGAAVPVSLYFRDESNFTDLEKKAMSLCTGRILDVGAGAGSQSVVLQRSGHVLTALDISPYAVEVMRRRGVTDAHCADIFAFEGGPFDTLLMLGHGIGMVETMEGLSRFLVRVHALLAVNGQLLIDSLDVRVTNDPENLAYHETNRKLGRYIGEIRMRFEFHGLVGPYCGWLHVDADTLREQSKLAGWQCHVVHQGANGDYLARLTRQKAA